MDIYYNSTRGGENNCKASVAILNGLAKDGGLFVPNFIPSLDKDLCTLSKMGYQELAYEIMKLYFTDFSKDELQYCIKNAYNDKFDTKEIAPMVEADGTNYLELFHGSTIAFKDMALSILPYLMKTAAKKNQITNDIVILTATSGDTGKAALSGFANVEGTKIIVFYPKDGVSHIQEKQMVTQKGNNTFVVGIDGNFDDAQTGVKNIFSDSALIQKLNKAGFQFSSANSINIGRLIPQIVYYVYAYCTLLRENKIIEGEKINFCVPTGNFGNILAAYYAKKMGLPINKLICASNENKVLFDFFKTGKYDRKREFMLTSSPSMDILVSSNLERLIYAIAGNDADACQDLMSQLNVAGNYTISEKMQKELTDFIPGFTTGEETIAEIKRLFLKDKYVLDPHTAVASAVYKQYKDVSKDPSVTVIVSTASPYKFTESVMEALANSLTKLPDFEMIDALSKISDVLVPPAIEEIREATTTHTTIWAVEDMKQVVIDYLDV